MNESIDESLQSLNDLNCNINSYSLSELQTDETYKLFLSDNFDSQTISSMPLMTINEKIIKITNGIEILNKSLHSLVCDKYEDLLAQSTKIETLEEVLKVIETKIQLLLTALERIRAKLIEPFNRISEQMLLLSRLQITCDLFRRTIRIIHLGKRLNESKLEETEPTLLIREMTKVGQYINEMDSIISDDSNGLLRKIDVIQSDIRLAKSLKTKVIKLANDVLEMGLTKQENNQISASLQVFHSLKILNQKVEQIRAEKEEYISKAIKEAIDVTLINVQNKSITGPGRVVMPMTIGQSCHLRSTLVSNIDRLLETIYCCLSEMNAIYKIIKKKRDASTHICWIDSLQNTDGVNQFWIHVIKSLSQQLCKAANDSAILKQALEAEYPKLLNSLSELWKRIARQEMTEDMNAEKALRSAMQPFESAYLSRSLSLLFDSVNRVFADAKETALTSIGSTNIPSNVPSNEDIVTIVKHISNELHVANVDLVLCKSVAKNVSKTINLFVVKCEQLTSVDGHSTQVIGPLTNSQLINATIVHRLESFRIQINNLLVSSSCSIEALNIVEQSLGSIETLMTNTINPIMNSVIDAIEAIILTMHSENYCSQNDSNDSQCSLYMKELQGFIARVTNDYFKELPDCEITQKSIHLLADRTIELFLRHITLIRPLSNSGRMKIAADFAQLEMGIIPLCQRIGDLGKSYRILRSFKPLLFQNAETICKSAAIGDLIPHSLILEFLISGFGSNDMKSPHQSMSWSLSRYSKWLDEHQSEAERLAFINNGLESYVKQVRRQHETSFASIYPILLELLQKAIQKTAEQ